MLFIQTKQDRMQIFKEILFFEGEDSLRKRIPLKICILSCIVGLKNVQYNLLGVLDHTMIAEMGFETFTWQTVCLLQSLPLCGRLQCPKQTTCHTIIAHL